MQMSQLTKAEAAKHVTGEVLVVVHDKDGNPIVEKTPDERMVYRVQKVPVSAETILDFAVRGDQLSVVTIDGQKLTAKLPAANRK